MRRIITSMIKKKADDDVSLVLIFSPKVAMVAA